MKISRLAAAVLPLVLLTACANYRIRTDYDTTRSFAAYKTYDWTSRTSKGERQASDSIMDRRVRAAVERELGAKGFQRSGDRDPDFLVAYYPILRQRVDHTAVHTGIGFGGPFMRTHIGTTHVTPHHYQEGTLVVEVRDFRSNEVVWHGAAEGALTPTGDAQDTDEQVAHAVRDLLDRFPPKR